MIKQRIAIALLSLSAAGFAGLAMQEGYSNNAIIPVPGDVPTYGLGSTVKEDGSAVRLGDKITPQLAIRLAVKDVSIKEDRLRDCFGDAHLAQHEYDAFVDLSYNVGVAAVCHSSIPGKVRREEYEAACNTILDFKSVQRRDCSLPANKKFCGGVWTRRLQMTKLCLTGERP